MNNDGSPIKKGGFLIQRIAQDGTTNCWKPLSVNLPCSLGAWFMVGGGGYASNFFKRWGC